MEINFGLIIRNAITIYNYKYKTLPQESTIVNNRVFYHINSTLLHILICMI